MNSKLLMFIKNFSYTLSSNLISLIISTLVIMIVPKIIGVEEYGYWQLYLFYTSYAGLFHFGWIDGIYLRYGGKEYSDLDKPLFFSQFWMLCITQVVIANAICIVAYFNINDVNKRFIFSMMALCCLIFIPRTMLWFILQFTNRIKEYSKVIIIDRIVYCLLIIILLCFSVKQYELMIVADLIGRFIGLAYSIYCCRDIVFRKITNFKVNLRETYTNLSVGVKLMFANIASMLIIGIVRFGIENVWGIATFGKVSLTMSICNVMMIFINAVGIIMFPMLRRMDQSKLPETYSKLRTVLVVPILAILVFYYPMSKLLSLWLPQYADGLTYMALLFPMCVYEGKMSLLINTYYNTLRKEKDILTINLTTVCLSIITTGIVIVWQKNLTLAVLSIVGLLAFRAIIAEIVLSNILEVEVKKDIILELTMTIIFILTGWYFNVWIAASIYLLAYISYIIIKKNDILYIIRDMKQLIKSKKV